MRGNNCINSSVKKHFVGRDIFSFPYLEREVGMRIWIYLLSEKKLRGKKNTFYLIHRLWYESFVVLCLIEFTWWGMKAVFIPISTACLALCFVCIHDTLLFLPAHLQRGHWYSYSCRPWGPHHCFSDLAKMESEGSVAWLHINIFSLSQASLIFITMWLPRSYDSY